MTYQECIWKDKSVLVVSLLSKSRKVHMYVRKFVGKTGVVVGESKNGMLLIRFKGNHKTRYRAIPAGCVIQSTP